jgi:protoporphyrin/coproporphyrin ferrochelatase
MSKDAILLIAHGSPERVEDIPEFLLNVSRGRPLPEAVVREVQHRYSLICSSPLTRITRRQADGVAGELGLPVYVGMRNWHPFIADTLRQMAADGVERAVAICLAPHNSRLSVGLYRRALLGETGARGGPRPPAVGECGVSIPGTTPFTVDFVSEWHAEPLLIRAFSERLRDGWSRACREANAAVPVLFTAHSVPVRTIEAPASATGGPPDGPYPTRGDDYERQTRETAALVAASVPELAGNWRFAFQSQGMSGGEWLGPTVESVIEELAAAGHKHFFVQAIGFVCDHVEVLYDIDIAFKNFAAARGIALSRAESLNDSVLFARAVAQLARTRLAAAPQPGG